jgi:glucokinase
MLALDLGGTKIAAARVDATGRITHRMKTATPPEGGRAVFEAMTSLLQQLPLEGVCALGVDVPGLVYPNGSVWAPNIAGWEKAPLRSVLKKRFKLPTLVESDRNASVMGEAWKGAARGCRDVVFVALGTGIGAGIISGGKLLRGHGELAGCVGWMAVGASGSLESQAAGRGISATAKRVYGRPITVEELVAKARKGESKARRIFEEAGRLLGLALANMVSTIAPEKIVIGGGVAAVGDLLLRPARETMRRWAQPLAVKQVRVVRSRLGNDAALLGVAKMAMEFRLTNSA